MLLKGMVVKHSKNYKGKVRLLQEQATHEGVLCCMQKCLRFDFFTKKPALLADGWIAAKCAAWKIAAMSLIDGSNSQVYKWKLKDVRKAAINKALKQRKTVHL